MQFTIPRRPLLRYTSLFLAFAWGLISLSIDVHSATKANQYKKFILSLAPPGTVINVDPGDLGRPAIVVSTMSALLAFSCFVITLCSFVPVLNRPRIHGAWLTFVTLFLFATVIRLTNVIATHSARVSVFVDGKQLSPDQVKGIEEANKVSPVYKKAPYFILLAIIPWIAILCGAVASALHLFAFNEKPNVGEKKVAGSINRSSSDDEKTSA